MSYRKKCLISLLLNLFLFISSFYCEGRDFFVGGAGNMAVRGLSTFKFFTIDSNLLAGVAGLVLSIELVSILLNRNYSPTLFATVLKFAGTCAVSLTLLVVLVFLGPVFGYPDIFAGNGLYFHLINPIVAIISYIWIDPKAPMPDKHLLFGMVPVILYASVYLTEVLLIGYENGGWADFYGFNSGFLAGKWPISVIAILLASAGIACGIHYAAKGGKKT